MKQPNITFDLWPDGAFTQQDVADLEDILSNIDLTSGQTSSDIRGLDVQTTIQFISLAVATGFFAKLGADIYNDLKSRFAKVLTKPIEKSKKQKTYESGDGGIIWMGTEIDKIHIRMTCIYENEEGIFKFINKMNKGLEWLKSEIENKGVDPSQQGEVEFKFVDREEGNLSGWHYTNNKLIFEIKIKKESRLIKVKDGEM